MSARATPGRGFGARLLPALLFAGAAAGPIVSCAATPPAISGEIDERSEAMALAWKLLADNKGVDGLLIIKKPDPAIAALLKDVAAACGSAANLIAEIAAREGIPLKETGLPPAELRVRSEITAATTRELLMSSGPNFERRVLLTQVEALGYGKVLLAEVAAQLETAGLAEDAEAIAAYGATLASLRKRTVDLLEVADSERRQ
ncbi:MAG: hypothetical protein ACO396_03045 [Phycisphaerales bacterium]